MKNNKKLYEEILEEITVSEKEEEELNKLAKKTLAVLKKNGCTAKIGGSFAKGTMINTGKADIDIFLLFKYSEDILTLEKKLTKIKGLGKIKKFTVLETITR